MQRLEDGSVLHSASDAVNFLECEHLTTLDLIDLDSRLHKCADDEHARLIQRKGHAHDARFLDGLRSRHATLADISASADDPPARAAAALAAMRRGDEIIYQATLVDHPFNGHADFLRRVNRPSDLGTHSYEVLDTRLSRTARAKCLVQLTFYSSLLRALQGVAPEAMHVVLGDHSEQSFRFADYASYFSGVAERYLHHVRSKHADTYPDPCSRCDLCKYREYCNERRRRCGVAAPGAREHRGTRPDRRLEGI